MSRQKRHDVAVLGVDPGLRATGWCVLYAPVTARPRAQVYYRATSTTYHYDARRAILCATGTWRRKDGDAEEWARQLCHAVSWYAAAMECDVIAIEDFTHRPWLGRRVNTAPAMGRLIGKLTSHLELTGSRPVFLAEAWETKRGMAPARTWFRNEHEFSAFCIANYARYFEILDREQRRAAFKRRAAP